MKKNLLYVIIISLITALAGTHLYILIFDPVKKIYVQQELKAIQTAKNDLLFSERQHAEFRSAVPTDFITAAKNSTGAVVFIRSIKSINDDPGERNTYSASSGSGVIISSDGYIVTNAHVVDDAEEVEVQLNNNKNYTASITGKDPSTDLAVLKIDEIGLDHLIFGDSDSLSVGEWVLAVGNPFKLQSTVTAGIVSAKARDINILENYGVESFIQTDAAVNPGNSGGALVNTLGELVGINAAIMTYSGKYEGYSFAIPSNLVRKVVKDLVDYGTVQRGWLGVTINEISDESATQLGLDAVEGVYIVNLLGGGAAQSAGLEKGDVILEVNGTKTGRVPEFMELIARHRPGDKVDLLFIRDGSKKTIEVTLRNQLNGTEIVVVKKDEVLEKIGIEIRNLDQAERQVHNEGVYVVSVMVNSIIDQTNLEPGFIIQKINNTPVNDADEVIELLKNNKGEILVEGVYDNYPGEFPYRFINPK